MFAHADNNSGSNVQISRRLRAQLALPHNIQTAQIEYIRCHYILVNTIRLRDDAIRLVHEMDNYSDSVVEQYLIAENAYINALSDFEHARTNMPIEYYH